MISPPLHGSPRASAFLGDRRAAILVWLKWITYAAATAQVTRFYFSLTSGIDLPAYLAGTAKLPYQKRYLAAILIRGILHAPLLGHLLQTHATLLSTSEHRASLILSGICLAIAGYFCVQLYRVVSAQQTLGLLVYPLFLVLTLLSYAVHVEQNLYLPYDMPSLAFFSAGLYVIYTRQYLWLLVIMICGTLNRDTTLFLVPLFVLDTISPSTEQESRFRWSEIPRLRALVLAVLWAAIEIGLSRHFAHNDRSETYSRLAENFHRLKPSSWPVLLNICGYLLPFVLVMSPLIRPRRFGNYAVVAALWVLVMLWYGVITETRIFGEMVPYVTVATVLLLEQYLAQAGAAAQPTPGTQPAS